MDDTGSQREISSPESRNCQASVFDVPWNQTRETKIAQLYEQRLSAASDFLERLRGHAGIKNVVTACRCSREK
jgi:hypothetical protein